MNKRLWRALLAAAVVCTLLGLLVAGCTQRGPAITAQGVTNLDSLTLSQDLVVGRAARVAAELAASNGLRVANNFTGTSASGVIRYGAGAFTKTLETNSISVTTGITAATAAISGGSTLTGEVVALNGVRPTGNLTGTSSSGMLRYGAGTISTTLQTNSISVTTGITGATLALSGPANVTGNLTVGGEITAANGAIYVGGESFLVPVYAGNGLRVTENLTGTAAAGMLRYGAAVISSTLDTNAISVTTGITAATAAVSGPSRLTGTVTLGTFLQYTSGVSQTVVNTQPITPTATYQTIAAAVDVFTDNLLRAGAVTGQLWILQNIGGPTITFTDANTCNLASTYAMGISDTLGLLFDGTSWVEIFRSNN
jgi:hypothetical protein